MVSGKTHVYNVYSDLNDKLLGTIEADNLDQAWRKAIVRWQTGALTVEVAASEGEPK